MAVNLALSDWHELPPGDPMGREGYGWWDTATDQDLWDVNRGIWIMASGAAQERFATLSYQGHILVVVEITGRTSHRVNGRTRWALEGTVLLPGDPVRDTLMGAEPPRTRNPVQYIATSDLDAMTTAERARTTTHTTATMIVTWNPNEWPNEEYSQEVAAIAAGSIVHGRWSTGVRRSGIEPGDRVFFLRQGVEPRGIIGSGTASSRIFQGDHWSDDRARDIANYVFIEWDTLVMPEDGIPHAELVARLPAGGEWRPQGSGWVLPPALSADLEQLWAEHLGQPAPVPPRTTPRQGWRLDPVRRKKVEDAAQDRLMEHYRAEGWQVQDVRFGNPYDAVATNGGTVLFLEAKGTETAGASVIVSRHEVDWARDHPGECVIGILSDITFLPSGDVDPTSGVFRVLEWNPDGGSLDPRLYDFTPGTPGTKRA